VVGNMLDERLGFKVSRYSLFCMSFSIASFLAMLVAIANREWVHVLIFLLAWFVGAYASLECLYQDHKQDQIS
jgi:hypothetical protein